jgi:hypothetical protein
VKPVEAIRSSSFWPTGRYSNVPLSDIVKIVAATGSGSSFPKNGVFGNYKPKLPKTRLFRKLEQLLVARAYVGLQTTLMVKCAPTINAQMPRHFVKLFRRETPRRCVLQRKNPKIVKRGAAALIAMCGSTKVLKHAG